MNNKRSYEHEGKTKIDSLVMVSMATSTNAYFFFVLEIIQTNCTCLVTNKSTVRNSGENVKPASTTKGPGKFNCNKEINQIIKAHSKKRGLL